MGCSRSYSQRKVVLWVLFRLQCDDTQKAYLDGENRVSPAWARRRLAYYTFVSVQVQQDLGQIQHNTRVHDQPANKSDC